MHTFFRHFWKALYKFFFGFATIGGFIILIVGLNNNWPDVIEFTTFIITTSVVILLSTIICNIFYVLYVTKVFSLPKVIMGTRQQLGDSEYSLCILEKSEYYSNNALVSFYYKDGVYERLIGLGYVQNVQDDGNIQVLLRWPKEIENGIIEGIQEDRRNIINKILVKPHIPREISD